MASRSPFDPARWPAQLPPRYWLAGARVPAALLDAAQARAAAQVALLVEDGRIAALAEQPQGDAPAFALDGATVCSAFVDPHTHLDKGDLLAMGLAPERDLAQAISAVQADYARWQPEELLARMGFALHEAWAQGCRALNSYCDWSQPDGPLAWELLQALRAQWRGRVELVLSSLAPIDLLADAAQAERLARAVARADGMLGLFVHAAPHVPALLTRAFALAERHGLRLDLHIDEHLDGARACTPLAARLARERGWGPRTVFGHACALAQAPEAALAATLDDMAACGAHLVALPLTNLHLQDSRGLPPWRTPRLRGLAPLHEAAARGVAVSLGCDNHRDPFFPLGELDPLRTLALATVAAQLDDPVHRWAASITCHPARALGLAWDGVLRPGAPADLVLHPGRSSAEVLSRPELGRQVLRAGQRLQLPRADFRDLDGLRSAPKPARQP